MIFTGVSVFYKLFLNCEQLKLIYFRMCNSDHTIKIIVYHKLKSVLPHIYVCSHELYTHTHGHVRAHTHVCSHELAACLVNG